MPSTWFTAAARSARESISVPSRSKTTCSKTRTLGRKGGAAAAGVGGLRIRELEPSTVQAAHEVDLGSREVRRARRVDDDAHTAEVADQIALLNALVEIEV